MIRTRREPLKKRTLEDIFSEDDSMGLLDVQTSASPAATADSRLIETLQAIERFLEDQGREPDSEASELSEATLGVKLLALRNNPEYVRALSEFDRLNLLDASDAGGQSDGRQAADKSEVQQELPTANAPPSEQGPTSVSPDSVTSLDDIWNSDTLGLLGEDDEATEALFEMTHVPESSEKDFPDEYAKRTQCDDFYRFEGLFDQVREDLREGDAEAVRFQKESQVDQGDMFILNGMLCVADQIGEESVGAGKKFNPRLRVVFDNGTESNLLLRSLSRALYRDDTGRRILRQGTTFDAMQGIDHHDERTGVIYILRSLSRDPALRSIRNLHKIGYTEKSLKTRISGAERQQTYLEAPVEIATSFECYNLDPRRFERLVHAMLHHQRVNVTLKSQNGSTYRPREWFDIELNTAREVVRRIVDGTIAQYRMDNTTGRLVKK